jgi:hypothetical protein
MQAAAEEKEKKLKGFAPVATQGFGRGWRCRVEASEKAGGPRLSLECPNPPRVVAMYVSTGGAAAEEVLVLVSSSCNCKASLRGLSKTGGGKLALLGPAVRKETKKQMKTKTTKGELVLKDLEILEMLEILESFKAWRLGGSRRKTDLVCWTLGDSVGDDGSTRLLREGYSVLLTTIQMIDDCQDGIAIRVKRTPSRGAPRPIDPLPLPLSLPPPRPSRLVAGLGSAWSLRRRSRKKRAPDASRPLRCIGKANCIPCCSFASGAGNGYCCMQCLHTPCMYNVHQPWNGIILQRLIHQRRRNSHTSSSASPAQGATVRTSLNFESPRLGPETAHDVPVAYQPSAAIGGKQLHGNHCCTHASIGQSWLANSMPEALFPAQ